MTRPNTRAQQRAFLDAFGQCGVVLLAAKATGIDRQRHYGWLKTDPDYQAAFTDAVEVAADTLEVELIRRARDGWQEPVFGKLAGRDQGTGQVGTITRFDSRLLELAIKRWRPAYREHQQAQQVSITPLAIVYLPDNHRNPTLTIDAPPADTTATRLRARETARAPLPAASATPANGPAPIGETTAPHRGRSRASLSTGRGRGRLS